MKLTMLLLCALSLATYTTTRAASLTTQVSFEGAGFPDAVFKAHLHAAPCDQDGGGHFNGGDGVTVDAVNENWPEVACTEGKCSGMASNGWAVPANSLSSGLSIVVHDTPAATSGSGSKMMCADLAMDDAGMYSGNFATLASYAGTGYGGSTGSASLLQVGSRTAVGFSGDDFGDNAFKAHLHAAPCASDGGPHFNGGDGVTVDAVNENWPEVTCTKGKCSGMAASDWAPTEAQLAAGLSIVVHDTPAAATGSGKKMLCSDLASVEAGQYEGTFAYLTSYTGAGYGDLSGTHSATLEKVSATSTSASFSGEGFTGPYKAHLHAKPCAEDGGGHYNGGDGVTVDAVNENWPEVTCTKGKCSGAAVSDWFPATSDSSLSIVVHDTPVATSGSGAKMLCADLDGGKAEFSYLTSYAGAGYGSVKKGSRATLKATTVDDCDSKLFQQYTKTGFTVASKNDAFMSITKIKKAFKAIKESYRAAKTNLRKLGREAKE